MNQRYIREIDFIELFFRILEKWRKVLGAALLFALLLGSLKAVTGFHTLNDPDRLAKNQREAAAKQKQYEDAKAYGEMQVENLKKEIEKQTDYLDKSILMQIDPFNEYRELVTYYIDTDYKIMPGMTYQNIDRTNGIVDAYVKSLEDNEIYSQVLTKLGRTDDPAVFRELVRSTDVQSDSYRDNGTLTVTTLGSDPAMAAALMEAVEEHLQEKEKEIQASVGSHELKEVNRVSGYKVDIELSDRQTTLRDNLTKMQEAEVKKQKEVLDLKNPRSEGMTVGSVVKEAVGYGLLGVFLGAFLAACGVSVRFLSGSAMPGEDELKNFYGISLLGRFRKDPGTGIDRKIAEWEGFRASEMDEKRAFEIIAANIRNRIGEAKPALLIGSPAPEVQEKVYEQLFSSEDLDRETLILGGNLVEDPEVIRKLNEVRSVVFLEDRDKSRNADFAKAVSMVKQQKKEILGLVELS